MSDVEVIQNCLRLCEHLSDMIEDDRIEMAHHLEGEAMRSYDELTRLETDLLADCKKLIDRGR